MATFFLDAEKVARVVSAIKEQRPPEDFVSPQVMYLNCLELTQKGKISLSAFPEEAITFASDNLTDTSGSENAYFAFRKLAQSWCETQGVKPRFPLMFDLFEALCLDKDGQNVIIRKKAPSVEFGGVKHSSAGNNSRAVYVQPHYVQETLEKRVANLLAHLVCLDKSIKNTAKINDKAFSEFNLQDKLNLLGLQQLEAALHNPPFTPEEKEHIKAMDSFKEVIAHFSGSPEWNQFLVYAQYLTTLGVLRCSFEPCKRSVLGVAPKTVEDWNKQHAERLKKKGYNTNS